MRLAPRWSWQLKVEPKKVEDSTFRNYLFIRFKEDVAEVFFGSRRVSGLRFV